MEMVLDETGESLCKTTPHYGTGDAAMNEAGYAAGIPPCIWGHEEAGP